MSRKENVLYHILFLFSMHIFSGDNWFSSLELAQELKQHRISFIGTIRKNSRAVPPIARSTVGRVRKDTKVYYDNHGTALVSFWDKGTHPVLLIDTLHRTIPIPEVNQKCQTVMEYNRTKSGVDMFDKRVKGFSCKRKCRRWPYAIFSNMVDIATNNGCIIYHHAGVNVGIRQNETHYNFLKNVGYQLVDKHIKRRIVEGPMNLAVRTAMEAIGYNLNGNIDQGTSNALKLNPKKRCAICPGDKDRKTAWACPRCLKPCCMEHRSDLCKTCAGPV
jgi:hypothetical protein